MSLFMSLQWFVAGREAGGLRGIPRSGEPLPRHEFVNELTMICRRPGRPAENKNKIPKIRNFKKKYCYNNSNSRPLGRPIFNIIINTSN